jgi:hypothetical protein
MVLVLCSGMVAPAEDPNPIKLLIITGDHGNRS